jgi:hypothetical protein
MSEKILARWKEKEYGSFMNRRQELLKRLDGKWREFLESYAGLPESELLKQGVTGHWSVRDIVVHVTAWEEETLKHLPLVLLGSRLPRYSDQYGGIDAFNAQTTADRKNLSFPEALRQQDLVHRRLVRFVESVPEEHLGSTTRFCRRLRLDTYGHYAKHAAAIRKWRNGITNCELRIKTYCPVVRFSFYFVIRNS